MTTTTRRGSVTALAILVLAAPDDVQAATIERGDDGAAVFRGGAGATSVNLGAADGGRVRFSTGLGDEIVAAAEGCERFDDDPYTVLCAPGAGVRVELGDGDDVAKVQEPLPAVALLDGGDGADALSGVYEGGAETLIGGAGNDSLNGRGGDDVADGGPGDDSVRGGPGADRVLGGEGSDALSGDDDATVSADVPDGGPGGDAVGREWSPAGRGGRGLVAVTLAGGADGAVGGGGGEVRDVERIASVSGGTYVGTDGAEELLVGGEAATVDGRGGDDRIETSYSADTIDGGAGADAIRGYGGDDRIAGGPGGDTIYGDTQGQVCNALTCSIHSGNDTIDARDGEADSIDCGLGTDRLRADAADVHANCEEVDAGPGEPPKGDDPARATIAFPKQSLRRALTRGATVSVAGAKPGRLSLKARLGRTVVATGTLTVAADGRAKGRLVFTRAGRQRLRGVRRATLAVSGGGASAKLKLS